MIVIYLPRNVEWIKYAFTIALPIAVFGSLLLHAVFGTAAVKALAELEKSATDKSSVPLQMVNVEGLDALGDGSAGSGGGDPLKEADQDAWAQKSPFLPTPESIPEAVPKLRDLLKLADPDELADLPISAANAAQYGELDKELAKKLIMGGRRGAGAEDGKGTDGSAGTGPGGTGANSTRARTLRWVMRFSVRGGDDYVYQLGVMGAEILVPLPPQNKNCLYFADPRNPGNRRVTTPDELGKLANQVRFSDTRPESVRGVCEALGVREPAQSFWAFFPKKLEDELARKEANYRNRRAEDIEETVFRVVVRGGTYDIVVDDQVPKR